MTKVSTHEETGIQRSAGREHLAVHPTTGHDKTRFLLTSVVHAGINNLPKDLSARIAQALNSADQAQEQQAPLADWVPAEVRAQAAQSGYGNAFESIRAYVPWRVALFSEAGAPLYPAPRPGGPLTATVVGPAGHRSYTVQYRETDLAFVSRLLAREGLVYRFEMDESAQSSTPLGHKFIILADITQAASCPEDATSAPSSGVRFRRASSQEQQDAIQVLGGLRQLQAASSVTSVWNYKSKRTITASVPTAAAFPGPARCSISRRNTTVLPAAPDRREFESLRTNRPHP